MRLALRLGPTEASASMLVGAIGNSTSIQRGWRDHCAPRRACTRNLAHKRAEQCLAIIAPAFTREDPLLSGDLSPMVFALVSVGGE